MKIQEILKNVTLSAKFENDKLTIVSVSKQEGEKEFSFDINGEENDFWDAVMIEGTIFDINLWDNDGELTLTIYGVLTENTESNNFMRILLDGQPTEEQTEEFVRENTEKILLQTFSLIGMDKPENFDKILDFVTADVLETSDSESGFMSEGDVIIGFRRFIEQVGN